MKTNALLLCSLFLLPTLPACGSSSAENYVEKSTQLTCQYSQKCEEAQWNEAGFDSVSDCKEKLLDTELVPGQGTRRNAFVAGCTDFDSAAARTCLAAARKVKRSCDEDVVNDDQKKACAEVCGPATRVGELLANPTNEDVVVEIIEELVAHGELELDEAP